MNTTMDHHAAGAGTLWCDDLDVFEILIICHENIRQRLGVLEDVGRDLLESETFSDHHLALLCRTLAFLDVVIPIHTADEEDTLFPELRRLCPRGAHPLPALRDAQLEHQGHGIQETRLKAAIVQSDSRHAGRLALDICEEYRYHLQQEEKILFPCAREVLDDPALLEAMAEEMRVRRRVHGVRNDG